MTAPNRRWFRFSLRTLFMVVTLVAGALAWAAYHSEPGVRMTNAGFYVEIPTPLWLQLFGEPGLEALEVPKSQHSRARDLFPEAILHLR